MARAATKQKGSGGAARPAAPPKVGMEIDGKVYPFPTDYSLGETEGIVAIWGVDSMMDIPEEKEHLLNPTHVRVLCWVLLRRAARAGKLACLTCDGKAGKRETCESCYGTGRQGDFTVEDSEDINWSRVKPVLPDPILDAIANGAEAGADAGPPAEAPGTGKERATRSPRASSRTSSGRNTTA